MGGARKGNGPSKGTVGGATPGVRAALRLLAAAYPPGGSGDDPWQNAVALAELRRAGVTRVDVRRLVRDGLAECKIEVTKPRSRRRQFKPWDNRTGAIPDASCFVLTERGVPVARAAAGDGRPAARSQPARRVQRPRWDGECRLYWGREVIKEFARTAPDQMHALAEFQRQRWKKTIDFSAVLSVLGKTGIRAAKWIVDTTRDLNRELRRVKFHMDSKARLIRWEFVG